MRRSCRYPRFGFVALTLLGACVLLLIVGARAGQPKIDLIQPFLTNQVLIHFDTEANRTYELQYIDELAATGSSARWSNLFVAPLTEFPNHYVVPDTRTSQQRFYRLRVTP
jgi:hypothetical protein